MSSLEAANRDTLSLLESKNTVYERLDNMKQFDHLASTQDGKCKSRGASESVLNKRLAEFKQQAQPAKVLALEELTTLTAPPTALV